MEKNNLMFMPDQCVEKIISSLPFKPKTDPQKYSFCFNSPFTKSEEKMPKQELTGDEKKIIIILDQLLQQIVYFSRNYSEEEFHCIYNSYIILRKILFLKIINRLSLDVNKTYCISHREGCWIILNSPSVINWGVEDDDCIVKNLIQSLCRLPQSATIM